MTKVLVLVIGGGNVSTYIEKLLQEKLPGIYIVPRNNVHDLLHHIERIMRTDVDITIANVSCSKTPKLYEILDTFPLRLHIIDFCFNCCRRCCHEGLVCLPLYISLARILILRIKSLFEYLIRLEVEIQISSEELNWLSSLLDLKLNQIKQSIVECLSDEERSYYSIKLDEKNTNITVKALGQPRGSKGIMQLNYTVHSRPIWGSTYIGHFLAEIASMMMLWFYEDSLKNEVDIATRIGVDEGIYTTYISKLIDCGVDLRIEITPGTS